jgi:hypothetical protein
MSAKIQIVKKEFSMKKIWKWILGIVLVLVVVGALVAAPFVMRNYMMANYSYRAAPQFAPQTNPQAPGWNNGPRQRGNDQWQGPQGQAPGRFEGRQMPMMKNGRNFQRGFMPFGGFTPFGFGLMFLGGLLRLIPLALFGLLLYGVYQLGKRAGIRSAQVAAAPVVPPVAAGSETPAE